ncbi:protein kinase domain-containing protein [Herbidospora cretacea]|uniref:protein kinase domain-containing protein n=1 Tax=Herbidospora cretacea TaxID=28444 RepID=UPI0023B88695|nr:protein kinase [Herbidospora cretacea]
MCGVSSYPTRWGKLDSCRHDADEVGELLAFPEYGFSVTKLLDEEVTKAAIFQWMAEAKRSGAEKIVFYFAGHGAVNDLGTFLVTYDNREFDEGVGLATLMTMLEPEPDSATETMLLLDCCHAGEAARLPASNFAVRRISNSDINQVVRQTDPSVVVIAACTGDQRAWEAANLGHGIFTYHLLAALLGEAADHTGSVTAHSIYEVVSREMANRDGHEQDPVFGGRVRGRMIIGRGLSPVLAPPRPEQEYAAIEVEAHAYLDSYNKLRATYDMQTWRSEGYFAACRKLEQINNWFAKKDLVEGLPGREQYRLAKETLLRFQSELGNVESSTRTRWGVLEHPLGSGGFGKVWLLRNANGDAGAYKLYHSNELHDHEKVKRFKNGYEAMRMLNHPRIVSVHDYSSCPPGFVMDYIEGKNLRDLAVGIFLEPIDIIPILLKCAEAVLHAHENDVIHRDIKPENIICRYGEDGTYSPYLTDFDLAWFSTQTQKATKTAMGVVYYAAPEQYVVFDPKAARSKTPTLDVFSFGQLMHFCLTNMDPEPLKVESNIDRLNQRLVHSAPASAVAGIIDLYRECTRFEPSDRISNFSEIIHRLDGIGQALSYTDSSANISTADYSRELIFQMTRVATPVTLDSFVNATRTWEIGLQWKEKSGQRKYTDYLSMHFRPTQRMSLENVSNERMRPIFNRRIDQAISAYPNATRHPGNKGEFQFYLDWRPDSMTLGDVPKLAGLLRDIFSVLQ